MGGGRVVGLCGRGASDAADTLCDSSRCLILFCQMSIIDGSITTLTVWEGDSTMRGDQQEERAMAVRRRRRRRTAWRGKFTCDGADPCLSHEFSTYSDMQPVSAVRQLLSEPASCSPTRQPTSRSSSPACPLHCACG